MDGIKAKFVAAWNACENPELDSENPHFHNKYASLKATLKAVREACKPNGIAYMQRLTYVMTDDGIDVNRRELASYVTDGNEQIELSRFPVECPPNPQSFGSNLTYAKRQQAQADWGITGEPDDDGEAAAAHAGQSHQKAANRRTNAARSAKKPVDKRKKMLIRCSELAAKCIENGMNAGATDSYMQAKYGVETMAELSDDQLIEFGTYLKTMEEQSRRLKAGKEQQ